MPELAAGWLVASGVPGFGIATMYTMKSPSRMALTLQSRFTDCPGASGSTYCVRCGDQSSGSTTSPCLSRLMMFIATISERDGPTALFVTAVLNSSGEPALKTVSDLSIVISSEASATGVGVAPACDGANWSAQPADGPAKPNRHAISAAATARPLARRPGRPTSRRTAGPAYQNSSTSMTRRNTTDDTRYSEYSATLRLLTRIPARKKREPVIGFSAWKKSPIRPPWARPCNCVGRRKMRYRVKLTSMLFLLLLHQKLTNIPRAVNAGASTVPTIAPHSAACPNTSSPCESTRVNGTVMRSATGQVEAAARYLPTTICRRLVGVSSSPSSVDRSRSPLSVSAPMIRPMKTETIIATFRSSYTISFGGIKLTRLSFACQYAYPPSRTAYAMVKLRALPPIHRSRNSRLNTSHQVAGTDGDGSNVRAFARRVALAGNAGAVGRGSTS